MAGKLPRRSHRTASRGCVIRISSHQYRAGRPPSRGKNRCRKSRDRSSGTCSLPQKRWPCRCGCSSRPCWRRLGIPRRSSRGSSHRPGCPSIFRPGPRSAGRSRPGSPHRRSRRWPRIGSLRSSRRGSLRSRRAGSIRIATVASARQEACARIGAAGRVHDPPDLWMAGRRAATGSASHRRRGRGGLGCRRRGAFRPVVANPIPDDVRRVLPHRFEELRSTARPAVRDDRRSRTRPGRVGHRPGMIRDPNLGLDPGPAVGLTADASPLRGTRWRRTRNSLTTLWVTGSGSASSPPPVELTVGMNRGESTG